MLDVNLHKAILTNVDMNQAVTGKRKPEQQPAVTKAAEIRDALTAPAGDKKIDLTINFDFNSDRLTDQGRAQVAEVAGALRSMKAPKIQIQGHTDNVGSDEYNQKLSQRRAAAVMYELMKIHQVFGKFEAMGYGETNPVDTNDTDLGRAHNRRVTIVNVSNAN
jgi:OOP family OmpA-OmpF porin